MSNLQLYNDAIGELTELLREVMESEGFKGLSEEEHKKLAKQVLRQILHHIDQVDNIHGRG